MADWRPSTDAVADLDLPATDDSPLAPRIVSPTRTNRIDLSDSLDWRYRRAWGLIVRIEETKAGNTETPLRVDIMARINFRADGHSVKTASSIYVLIQAYRSNLIVTEPAALLMGDIVAGVVSANYSGPGISHLAAWKHSDLSSWQNLAPNALFGDHFGDFEERAADWPLIIGGQLRGTRRRVKPYSCGADGSARGRSPNQYSRTT